MPIHVKTLISIPDSSWRNVRLVLFGKKDSVKGMDLETKVRYAIENVTKI